jgi:hypothetical protein
LQDFASATENIAAEKLQEFKRVIGSGRSAIFVIFFAQKVNFVANF